MITITLHLEMAITITWNHVIDYYYHNPGTDKYHFILNDVMW